MKRLFAVAILALSLAPTDAGAIEFTLFKQPFRLDITESLYLNYHANPGNGDASSANYGEILSRANVQLAWRRFLFGFRVDSGAWIHTPQVGDTLDDGGCEQIPKPPQCTVTASSVANRFGRTPFSPGEQIGAYGQIPFDPKRFFEKIFLSYSGRTFEWTIGDYYVSFGRGLVLSIRKLDELGVDTTLTGGRFVVHEGDFSAQLVAGWTNLQNIDEATATYNPDYVAKATSPLGSYDFVGGAHADYRFGGLVTVGAQAMGGLPARNGSSAVAQTDYYLRYGMSIDAPRLLPNLALYLEYARGDDRLTGTPRVGNAVYGSAVAYLGRTTLTLEYKDYQNWQPWHATNDPFGTIVYQQPPTLERVITQINNNTDITAGRARVDVQATRAVQVYASAQVGRSHPTEDITDTVYDFYAGANLRWNGGLSHAFPYVGYRLERDETDRSVEEQLIALEYDFAQALPHNLSIESQGLLWLREKPIGAAGAEEDWREGNVYLSLKWAPRLIAAVGYEFTTVSTEALHQHNFFNGSLTWNITSGTSLTLFGGGQRPGLKCISGVCRVFPAFNGARIALVVRL